MNQDKLLSLADDVLSRLLQGGASDAKVVARSGSELSARVRQGEVELVEEAGTQSIAVRAMRKMRIGHQPPGAKADAAAAAGERAGSTKGARIRPSRAMAPNRPGFSPGGSAPGGSAWP